MRYKTGLIMVLTAGVLWSFQALVIRQIDEAGAWTVLVWRSVGMLPVLLAFLAWKAGGSPWPAIRKAGPAGMMGATALVAAMGGAILAFQSTTIANAAFLLAASPFLAAVLGWLILSERVAPRTWAAIGLAMVGIMLMVREGLAAGALVGNLAALISALGFAAFSVALRWRKVDDSMPIVLVGASLAVVAGAIAASNAGQALIVPATDVLWCVAMGMITTAAGLYQRLATEREERKQRESHADLGRRWASGERESIRTSIEQAVGRLSRFGRPFEVADIADVVIADSDPTADDFTEGVREMCRAVLRRSPSRLVDGTIIPKFITTQLPDGSWVRVPTISATYADVARNLQMREEQLRQDQAALDKFREFVRRVASVSTDPEALVADILADSIKKDAA